MISSEPVSEALLPIYNQLQTLKRCLVEVKNSGGVGSPRELYPYSMKVNTNTLCVNRSVVLTQNFVAELHRQHESGREVHGGRRHS